MNLRWSIDNNVIYELFVNNQNIINPWGFETADSSAFFSLEEGVGWRYKCLEKSFDYDNKNFKAVLTTKMKEGKWKLFINDRILSDNELTRYVEAMCLEDSYFMDFVMRFRFKKEFIEYAEIAGNKIYHNNTNIYYQYPVNKVFLKGKKFDINIEIINCIIPAKMKPVMYVRDNKGEWVVHVRMLPKKADKEVIKICTRWAMTKPLPQYISKFLLNSKKIKDFLWYRGEISPINNNIFLKLFNPNAYPIVKVNKGNKLMWKVRMKIQ